MTRATLHDKAALIAGGAKNLGGLVSRDLAAHGAAAVAIHYNSDATKSDAEATAEAVRASGAGNTMSRGDLTRPDVCARLFDETIERFLATEGWWITGQTILANGGYTTR